MLTCDAQGGRVVYCISMRLPFLRAVALLASATPALAQSLSVGDKSLQLSAGFSWYSPRGSDWGTITHRRLYVTSMRWETILAKSKGFALASTSELVPFELVERTMGNTQNCYATKTGTTCERDRSARL